jgi:N-acetylneuraminate lyase
MNDFRLNGLLPAVFTPFDKDGEVNYSIIPEYADKLVSDGAIGVFVSGSTGECVSMTMEEKVGVIKAWVKAVGHRIKVVAHVGGTCQKDCIELARQSAEAGADAVAAVGPFYFRPARVEDLIEFYRPVAEAANGLPFYSYHIPVITGIKLSMVDFLKKGSKVIPNLNGVKYTHTDFMEMAECIALEDGRFDILNGYDEMLLSALAVGAKGGVGSTYNYAMSTYLNIMHCFEDGDMAGARKWQLKSIDIVNVIVRHGGGIRGGKAIMKALGMDCGNCRPPFAPFSEEEIENVNREIEEISL